MKKKVLSGVQPTGSIHLGNWLGAIKNWVELQHIHETYFCIVDLHAITVPQEPSSLKENTLSTAAIYIACGIDPELSSIFVQSHITAHSELCWILNCFTPLNWMERMIQFKEKAKKHGDNVSIGLFDYPILMAADILLYDADLVPVGEDQKQHLELARNIAQQRINSTYGNKDNHILKVPEPLIMKHGAKIMSLLDGTKKMSKSDPNENSRINMLDSPDVITKKIKRAKTDSFIGLEYDNPSRLEANNLLTIYSLTSGLKREDALIECSEMGWGKFKPLLTESIVSSLKPIQLKYKELIDDRAELESIISKGRDKAENKANDTLKRVRDVVGFLSRTEC